MKNRREFIKQSLMATAGTMFIPSFLKAHETIDGIAANGKKLVVIQLSGGNDGLNTVVPYRNDLYYENRPKLAIPSSQALKISDELGMHPALTSFQRLFDQGYVSVLNNVGYPNPDRSHFRSMEIWQCGSTDSHLASSGWIGRYLDAQCDKGISAHHAVEIDDSLGLALKGEKIKGLALRHPKKLYQALHTETVQEINAQNQQRAFEHSSLHYLYKTIAESTASADYIYQKTKVYQSKVEYPDTPLGNQLKTIAELICSGVETYVYYVSLPGFDTHIRQVDYHAKLLKIYADAVQAFVRDLDRNNRMEETLILTFSEFGRRVGENGSGGTDHGTANNVFIIGKNNRQKGFLNDTPDLMKLDRGDLVYQIDFRSIYATILNKWLGTTGNKILGGQFPLLDFI